MAVTLPARRILWISLAIAVFFAVSGGLGEYSAAFLPGDPLRLLRAFDFARGNLPTWFASAAYLGCALLLALITVHHWLSGSRPAALPWASAAMIFLALSANEIFAVEHNTLLDYARRLMRLVFDNTLLLFAVLGVVALVLVVVAIRLLASLPSQTRRGFVLAAVVFFGGAFGLQFAAELIVRGGGRGSLLYLLVSNGEEFCEIAGVLLFFFALLTYVESCIGEIRIAVKR